MLQGTSYDVIMRPLVVDILAFALPFAIGVTCFFVGRRVHGWSKARRWGLLSGAVAVAIVVGVVYGYPPNLRFAVWLYRFGGAAQWAIWSALILLGAAWSAPNRKMSSMFAVLVLGVLVLALVLGGNGRLLWRLFGDSMWQAKPNSAGCLTQSIGITCGPTSAAMLLHHYGISASEGEMVSAAPWNGAGIAR